MNDSAARWAASGLAWLTGRPDGPPDFSRPAVLTRAEAVAAELTARLDTRVDAAATLAGRAALLGLSRRGRISAGGATRLLATRDGWCALTLSRPDDIAAVPALVQDDAALDDPWPAVIRWAARHHSADVVERGVLLDLPVSRLGETPAAAPGVAAAGPRATPRRAAGLLVADLSSMWAGPLCGQLLTAAGATVVKVESPSRPDGTRSGDRHFYDWVNHGKLSYTVEFDDPRLRALLSVADVVIEGSRPAALARRRLGPHTLPGPPGRVWLRVTGYGPDSPRVAFGDDAAVAGGLVGDGPVFCADAIADPLTGLEAALAVVDSLQRGGGEVIDVALATVAACYAALPAEPTEPGAPVEARAPQPPPTAPPASAPGADNAAVGALVNQRRSVPC